ncbi:WD40 repeat domain-containing protein [Blastopirellula marina]|uniref:Probable vegetatible incompatibility protein n=1 Tax=Blastopirellula marina DSM 3645 TaxID=314230 RepID=A3ZYU8_9BACT|nr:c-type cytochrome domain-containing protein [Blastopirellula marina]EAQ78309.1 probable vegetatible incompatibility protein [Blastopirellula marina DSM 3645]
MPSKLFVFSLVLFFAPALLAEEDRTVSYFRDVRPIFQANCQGCHQPAKQGGDYVMTDFEKLIAGGESGGAAIVAGKPDESYLIELITPDEGKAEMPKGKKPLADADRQTLALWISQGAKDDTPASTRPTIDHDHPPVYSLPPVLTSIEYSPDGSMLAVSGYHEVLLQKADGSGVAQRLVGMSERIESARFSPDGERLVVAGGSPGRLGELQMWDVESGELTYSLPVSYDTIYGANWSPDGKQVSVGCGDNTVRVFNAETGDQVLFNGAHEDWALDTTFSVDGSHLVSVSRDMTMKLYEVKTERFIDNITSITPGALKGGIAAVMRHPTEDQLLIGGADGIPKIYKMFREKDRKIGDDFNLIRAFPALPGRVFDVAFSPDASLVAACSSNDQTGEIHLFNTADGKLLRQMAAQQGAVYSIAFSPDGQQLASVGFDGVVRINLVKDGTLVRQFSAVPLAAPAAAAN